MLHGSPPGWIALLTDFGLQDPYVGILKGVIAGIAPQAHVIDITHGIPPQNIAAGRFGLLSAYVHFPPATIFVAVVDPGVGSQRRAIAVQIKTGGILVGPDNGLFSGVLAQSPALAAVELNDRRYWLSPTPSHTFHGRDIFSPVAAHLSRGLPLSDLGSALDPASLVQLPIPACRPTARGWRGSVQYIDFYGNLLTTIPSQLVTGICYQIAVGQARIPIGRTFSEVAWGELIGLVGSHGWLSIALNGGSAQARLGLGYGDPVEIVPEG